VAVQEWKEHNPGGRVVERDFARTSLQAGGTGAVMQGRVSAGEFLAPYLTELAAAVSV